jgi:hypothetical protein
LEIEEQFKAENASKREEEEKDEDKILEIEELPENETAYDYQEN